VLRRAESCLKRLQVDCIELDNETTPVDETLQRASDCARRGATCYSLAAGLLTGKHGTFDEASSSKSDSIEAYLLVIAGE
jgi:hypothetical protein